MSSLPEIGVTGSTGAVGGLVALGLAERGIAQRLLVRTPDRAPRVDGAVAVPTSYADRALALRSLDGVRVLFMVSATEAPDRLDQHRTFIDAASEAGVEQLIYTSFYGAAADCTFTFGRDHYATEEHIRSRGLTHTFLRDNFYLDLLPSFAGEDGVIRGPAGDGRLAAIARADVAGVATEVLADPAAHRNVSYDLTGPQALTMAEIAAAIGEQTGRPVRFHDETVAEAYASRKRWPAPDWQYDAWVSTYTAIAAGELAAVSSDVERITGRRPILLAELLAGRG
ncbi:SDR family oxidoreductase [Microlunatus elymi]|nr:SDR family oxidoreductase [Microlunatus elymi]